jgi:parallel beta-helix repeat protein
MSDNVTLSGFEIRNHIGLSSYYSCIDVGKQDIYRYVVVNDCDMTDAYYGITIKGDNNTVSNCVIKNIQAYGIMIVSGMFNIISYNLIDTNSQGINLQCSTHTEIYNNTISNNREAGLKILSLSSNNHIYHNHFIDNSQNAYDANNENQWDNGYPSGGNNWSDYTGKDEYQGPNENLPGPDGIGDTPYNISGSNNRDLYPLGMFLKPPAGGNQPPTAYITYITPNPATEGQTISFSGGGSDSDGFITSYNWRSSIAGQLSTQQSFTTSNLQLGVHTIFFKVQDNEGEWSTEKTATVTVNSAVNAAPKSYIDEITPNPAKPGQAILLHGHGSDADGIISAYQWRLSNGGILGSNPSCIITNLTIGTYTINFMVMDDQSEWSSPATMILVIEQNTTVDPSNKAPIANIGGPYQGNINESVRFNASQSSDPDGTIRSYTWSFGDNSSDTGSSPTHIYINPGSYQVTVQVTDDDGASSRASTTIVITQVSSQPDSPSSAIHFALNIPFPVIVVTMFVTMILIFIMFIRWMKKK